MTHFTINGDRSWCILRNDGKNAAVAKNIAVRGAADQGSFFVDTLKVQKRSGSSKYEFSVNGTVLADTNLALGFDIVGIGLFCEEDLNLEFDNFYAGQEGATSIKWNPQQAARKTPVIKNKSVVSYDLLGRKRVTPLGANRVSTKIPNGMLLNEHGREINIRGKRNK
jgi:hypothetical protein